MTATPAWTLADAEEFLKWIADDLANLGVTAQVVGSVAMQGFETATHKPAQTCSLA